MHSCNGHLIKRVITQHPQALKESIEIAGASVIEGLVDSKPSVATSSIAILNDCWMACPEEMDVTFKRCGLMNTSEKIQIQCLDILTARVSSTPNISFKVFTSSVVKLLNSLSTQCSHRAADLLVLFFKTAREGAKEDLAKEMGLQGVKEFTATSILKSIGYKPPSRPNSSLSNSINYGMSDVGTPKTVASILNIDFLTNDTQYVVESIPPEQIYSVDTFKRDVTEMLPSFDGKETEFNWQQREKHITRLRSYLRGNGPTHYVDTIVWALKFNSAGILKAANSLRTTLSSAACQLIKEMAIILGNNIDPIAETYLSGIIKMTSLTKKITHTNANITTSAIFANTSYSIRLLNHIQVAMNEKNIQPRLFSGKWIRIILFRHRTAKSSMEATGGRDIIQSCISKGLSDASPGVREEMRLAFWAFNEVWPNIGQAMLEKLDNSTRKALERSNPQPQKSLVAVNTKATRAGPASLKDFITQSRERSVVHTATATGTASAAARKPFEKERVDKPVATKDLTVKATRLGLSQRAQRRIPQVGVVRSTTGTAGTISTSMRSGTRDQSRTNAKHTIQGSLATNEDLSGRESPSLQRIPVTHKEESKLASRTLIETPTSIGDQITSDDPALVLRGVQSIVEYWKAPGGSSVQLPSPSVLSRFFKAVFSTELSKSLSREKREIVTLLTHPNVVANLTQFVPVTEIALGSVQTQLEGMGVRSLEKILSKVGSFQERSSLCVYVISSCLQIDGNLKLRDASIEFCFSILKDVQSNNANTAGMMEDLKLLEAALDLAGHSEYTERYHLLLENLLKSLFASSPLNKISTAPAEVSGLTVESGSAVESSPTVKSISTVESGSAVESGLTVKSDSAVKPDSALESSSVIEPCSTVGSGSAVESSSAIESSSAVEPSLAVDSSSTVESSPTVKPGSTVDPKSTIECVTTHLKHHEHVEESELTESHPSVISIENPKSPQTDSFFSGNSITDPVLATITSKTEFSRDEDFSDPSPGTVTVEEMAKPVSSPPEKISSPIIESDESGTCPEAEIVLTGDNTNESVHDDLQTVTADVNTEKLPEMSGMDDETQMDSVVLDSESEVTSTALYFNNKATQNNIEIFEDNRDTPSPPNTSQLRHAEDDITWLKAETDINACSLSFDDDPGVVPRLFEQLSSGCINMHGLNKLITEVKALNSDSMALWKERGWLERIKPSLFKYFETRLGSDLSADQANRGLLLLNHSMIANGSLFFGEEETILKILLMLHDLPSSDKRSLIRGSLSIRDELLLLNPQASSQLLDASLNDFEVNWSQSSTSIPHKVFLLSTIAEIVKLPVVLDTFIDRFIPVITAALNSHDAMVRKQTYPVLLELLRSSEKDVVAEKVLVRLKEGERRLLDYYLTSNQM